MGALDGVAEAAGALGEAGFARVVAHSDADGIASAALVCQALRQAGARYHFTALDDPSTVGGTGEFTVYCDVGASYLDRISDGSVVIDHHPRRGSSDAVIVEGDASSSCGAYLVARKLGVRRPELALAGAVGDDALEEVPEEILGDAIERCGVREGVLIAGDDPVEALVHSTDPLTRFAGEEDAAREFVSDLAVSDSIEGFDDEEMRRYASSVVALAAENEAAEAENLEGVVGRRYSVEGVEIRSLAAYLEACGAAGKAGTALEACLFLDCGEAAGIYRDFQSRLITFLDSLEVGDGVAWIDGFDTGLVADVLADWVVSRPVVVADREGRVSLRASNVDCGEVLGELAESYGGSGGGHGSRGGASVQVEDLDDFVEELKGVVV